MEKQLYKCLVEEQNSEEAFFQIYWSWATVPGQAIQNILDSAKSNGLKNPIPYDIDEYDIDNLEAEVAPGSASNVFWSISRFYFPPEDTFQLPFGVIRSCTEGETDEIRRGYTLKEHENGLIYIEVNVECDNLLFLYSELLELNQIYEVFWYVLHDDLGDGDTDQFLINQQLNTPSKIIKHLSDYQLDSVKNGLVTITAYLEEGVTNLNISDHKRIIAITHSKDIADKYSQVLESFGYPKAQELLSIDCEMPHWHYRLPGSRNKDELVAMLKESSFTDWNPNQQ